MGKLMPRKLSTIYILPNLLEQQFEVVYTEAVTQILYAQDIIRIFTKR